MDTIDFFNAVWPASGIYAIARSYTTPDGNTVYPSESSKTIKEAAARALYHDSRGEDVFFNIHTLKSILPTGMRVQTNMLEAKVFFFDLDCGPTKPYVDQKDALTELKSFAYRFKLPKPLIVSSGRGLHVYWLMDQPMPSLDWRPYAAKLRQMADSAGLKYDPARTVDTSSLLRPVGTFNRKPGRAPAQVSMLLDGVVTPQADLLARIDAEFASLNTMLNLGKAAGEDDPYKLNWSGGTPTLEQLCDACSAAKWLIDQKGNVDQPTWFKCGIGLLRFTTGGNALVHKWSEPDPRYDPDMTDKKIAQSEAKANGPTRCSTMAVHCGAHHCRGCRFFDPSKDSSPAVHALKPQPLPAGQTTISNSTHTPLCEPKAPFKRTTRGIVISIKKKDPDDSAKLVDVEKLIAPYDLFPIEEVERTEFEEAYVLWCATIPQKGQHTFKLTPAQADRLEIALKNEGVHILPPDIPNVRTYMSAYVRELQEKLRAQKQYEHLGWVDDQTAFVLADKKLVMNAPPEAPIRLSYRAIDVKNYVTKRGDMSRQYEVLKFFHRDDRVHSQFMICASLAAPLVALTGLSSCVIHAWGEAGSSKSTSLKAAASLWGDPERYVVNATKKGMTVLAQDERFSTLTNLPLMLDEITGMDDEEARDFALGISQTGGRTTLNRGRQTIAPRGGLRATVVLTTGNKSLHTKMASRNTATDAGSMRVFEILLPKTPREEKPDGDKFLRALQENYGHIGEAFMERVMRGQNLDRVKATVAALMQEMDQRYKIEGSQRFWSVAITTAVLGARLGKQFGLLPYDEADILAWLDRVFPAMQGNVQEEYRKFDAANVLADFLNHHTGNILVTVRYAGQIGDAPVIEPHGDMVAHYDKHKEFATIRRDAMEDYCRRRGIGLMHMLTALQARGIVTDRDTRRVLGTGTNYAKGRSRCFLVNMLHPEMHDSVDMGKAAQGDNVVRFPAKPTPSPAADPAEKTAP